MRVNVELTGTRPLLHHQDNVDWSEKIKDWQKHPDNKGKSTAGDDRSPAWTWLGAMYHDGTHIAIPSDNIMTMLREGGAQVKTGKRSQTYKSQTQSGILPMEPFWTMKVNGSEVKVKELLDLEGVEDFSKHVETAKASGFELLVKRAKIGQSKHIRVRPFFIDWSCSGTLEVIDETITIEILRLILDVAGRLKGICDWRPSSKTPGGFGTFTATVEEI